MSDLRMDVFLVGKTQPGVEVPTLVSNLAAAFKKDPSTFEKMLKRKRSLLKANIDPALAAKYKEIVEKAGGVCELIDKALAPDSANAAQADADKKEAKQESKKRDADKADEKQKESKEQAAVQKQESLAFELTANTSGALFVVLPSDGDGTQTDAEESEPAQSKVRYCYNCGTETPPDAIECPHCFAVQNERFSEPPVAVKSSFIQDKLKPQIDVVVQKLHSLRDAFLLKLTSLKKPIETVQPAQTPKTANVKTLVVALSFFLFVIITGILVINSLPAYKEYAIRNKLQSASPLIDNARTKVAAYIKKTKTFPDKNVLVSLPENISNNVVQSILVQEGANIKVTFRIEGLHEKNTIIYTPIEKNDQILWSCKGGTLADTYREPECRADEAASVVGTEKSTDVAISTSQAVSQPSSSVTMSSSTVSAELYSKDKRISIRPAKGVVENREYDATALISATNINDEIYVLVFEEPKADFNNGITLADYTEKLLANAVASLDEGKKVGEIRQLKINNLPATQFVISGYVQDAKLGYVISVIETDTMFYRVMSWTMGNKFEKNKVLLMVMTESFKLHNPPETPVAQ